MPTGIIKSITDKGFGFIIPNDGGDDVFFHQNDIREGEAVEGAQVDFKKVPSKKKQGKFQAEDIVVYGEPEISANSGGAVRNSTHKPRGGEKVLPETCIFDSFFDDQGNLHESLFFEAAQQTAEVFRRSGLKSSQFRQLYQGYLSFAGRLRQGKMEFGEAKERFGVFFVERVVRQNERRHLPDVLRSFFEQHREVVFRNAEEMLGLFRYLTNIYCYFGESS